MPFEKASLMVLCLLLGMGGSSALAQEGPDAPPKAGATQDEILLRLRQLQTNYTYFASLGLSYSFGSIFNNAVNTRFGGAGGGGNGIIISQ